MVTDSPANSWMNKVPQTSGVPGDEGWVWGARWMNYVLHTFDVIRLTVDPFGLSCTPLYSAQALHYSIEFCVFDQITSLGPLLNSGLASQLWVFALDWWSIARMPFLFCGSAWAPAQGGCPDCSELLLWKGTWEQENVFGCGPGALVVHMKIMSLSFQ